MKILVLSSYSALGASSRLRLLQYALYLESAGIEITVRPLLSDEYLQHLYTTKAVPLSLVARAYLRRLVALLKNRQFDLLWIEKELLPNVPAWIEWFLARLKIPYIVDYDDATFHRYDLHSNSIIRKLLGNKIAQVMHNAAAVVVGNDYLASYARQSGAKHIECVPTVIDLERYPKMPAKQNSVFTIGWIGSPSTTKYLQLVQQALQQFSQDKSIRLLLIGAEPISLPGVNVEILPWEEAAEVANLQQCDVGIMPLFDSPWELGKCGYKLIQYMACSLPTIASPVGVNREIVDHGTTGYLAATTADWLSALEALYADAALRTKMGEAGRAKVESSYSLQVQAPRLLTLFNQLMSQQSVEKTER